MSRSQSEIRVCDENSVLIEIKLSSDQLSIGGIFTLEWSRIVIAAILRRLNAFYMLVAFALSVSANGNIISSRACFPNMNFS